MPVLSLAALLRLPHLALTMSCKPQLLVSSNLTAIDISESPFQS